MNLFRDLNEVQKEAASHIDGAMLILAGAGSGKTKTLTTRLAYLIDEVGIEANSTLTLTFTNKAANVMKDRALAMIKRQNFGTPLLCTFHKFGLLFLRLHIERLKRKNDFIIIDTDDVKKILKEIMSEDSKLRTSSVLNSISYYKNESINSKMLLENLDQIQENKENFEEFITIFQAYENYLLRCNLVDFDDLLLLSSQILDQDKTFAKEQSLKYRYIMVDEYQDTNALQYKLLKQLCSSHENLSVVGDDDQSIYSWRGAKIENILNFQNEFHNVKLVKLEQNYRSVGVILKAANELIAHNEKRLGKTLICTKENGEEIEIYEAQDEKQESARVVSKIKELLLRGVAPSEIAVLFRVNALSRALEEALMRKKIPYKILSGMKFYERMEIKDIIAYLRFLANLSDDFSFKRIINRPKRGFGKTSLEKLETFAKKERISLFEALCNVEGSSFFNPKLEKEIAIFIENIKSLKEMNLKDLFANFENKIKLKDFYEEQGDNDRNSNIDEFYSNLKEMAKEYENLNEILSEISLSSDQDGIEGESIYLMSIHASKGLEFDYVFIVGLEEGFFPLLNESNIEEERRLAYVAITRAKKALHLSCANLRNYRGNRTSLNKSRFLRESKLQEELEYKEKITNFTKGELIQHKIFGIGRILEVKMKEKDTVLVINFGGIERSILSSFVEKVRSIE